MRNRRGRTKFLTKMPMGGIVAEVGVAEGEHARLIRDITKPKRLYLVDPWVSANNPNYGSDAMKLISDDGVDILEEGKFSVGIHKDDIVAMKEYSVEASKKFPDEFFDYVYIDANHSYESVKEDIEHWYPKVKPGGYISGHDYRHGQRSGLAAKYGVVRAVHELLEEYGLELISRYRGFDWAVLKN
jgi:hypothetical protein